MCRIFGHLGLKVSEENLSRAQHSMIRGGPDSQQLSRGKNWVLGCNRLAIQDPCAGSQPLSNLDNSVHAVFNGEIYNFRSIRNKLARHGVRVEGDADSSVIVPYYELHGDRFIERLEGMFAIALIDLRVRPVLKMWTDPLGVKSLYYSAEGGSLAFASELKALELLLGDASRIDPLGIDHFMNWQTIPLSGSWLNNVRSVPPGSALRWDGVALHEGTIRWHGDHRTEDDERWALGDLLEREIDQMVLQNAPIAIQLSGGVDSSLIAAMVARRRTDTRAFHVRLAGDPDSELKFAQIAARYAGIPLEIVDIGVDELPSRMAMASRALGTPNATPHAVSAHALLETISASGYRVCFVGDGADEQFGGYRRYSAAMSDQSPRWQDAYLDRLSLIPRYRYWSMYTGEYKALLEGQSSRELALLALKSSKGTRLDRLLQFDLKYKLPSLNLRKLDHLSMDFAVEARVPFCQPSVTEFARRAPESMKIFGAERKRVLLDVAADWVPSEIIERPKQPFTLPVASVMPAKGHLWSFVQDVLHFPRLTDWGYFRQDAIRQVLREQGEGHDHSRLIWGLTMLELSLQDAPS